MLIKKLASCLLVALACVTASFSGQAAMVGTAQMSTDPYHIDLINISQKREWIHEQLVEAGVADADAQLRVAAMTDAQVEQIHQRIDSAPAGGNAAIAIILILLITELTGVTDIIPSIRPAN